MDTDKYDGEETSGSSDMLASWFDADRRGRFILTIDCSLRWCNAAGRSLLTGGGSLLLRNGSLRPRQQAHAQSFAQFIKEAKEELSIYCLNDEEEHHLVLAVRALGASGVVGLTAYDADEPFDYHWADLGQAFGLTASERDIAQALGSGLTAEGIADHFSISVKTVRTHIRHIYSKLDVSSREELFHKLAPYMLTD